MTTPMPKAEREPTAEPTTDMGPSGNWMARELKAAWAFAKRDWDRTKHDLEELKEDFVQARQSQHQTAESHGSKPVRLADYKPTLGEPPKEKHGWSLNNPHHGGTQGHRETGR